MLSNTDFSIFLQTYKWTFEDPNFSLLAIEIANSDQTPEQITTFFEERANFIIADLRDEAVVTFFGIHRRDLLRGSRITISLRLHFRFIDPDINFSAI